MFDELAQIAFAVTLILPGFIVVQLSERRRASNPAGSDLELILRGLIYALIFQSVGLLSGWLTDVARDLTEGETIEHLDAAALYALVLCVAVPTAIGLGLGKLLADAEGDGALRWWHYALGGRDVRRAWDYSFARNNAGYIRVFLVDQPDGSPPALLGRFGKDSWASQAPAEPDLYLQQTWRADDNGQISAESFANPLGPVWLSAERIARIEVV